MSSISRAPDGASGDLRLISGRRDYDGGVFGVPSLYESAAGDVPGQTAPMVGRAPMRLDGSAFDQAFYVGLHP